MFSGCNSLESLNLSSFNTSLVKNMSFMFYGSYFLNFLFISNFFIMDNVKNYTDMFSNPCIHIDINNSDSNFFYYFNDIIDLCSNFIELKILPKSENEILKMINNLNFTTIYINGIEINSDENNYKIKQNNIHNIKIIFPDDFNSSCENMFNGMNEIIKIKFKNFKGCNNTSKMFYNCSSLENIELSSFEISGNNNDMSSMFEKCNKLTKIKFPSSFNTSLVNNVEYMFSECSSLQSLDLSSFDTSSVNNMKYMFSGCSKLK